ncbi:YesK family protein [Evansella sp. AB-rgal1]|uniref:YesK family protein n=1 Tax=Evansella sp. AB-rgal1 TaxID=3242696 RepID=UPI00359F12CB
MELLSAIISISLPVTAVYLLVTFFISKFLPEKKLEVYVAGFFILLCVLTIVVAQQVGGWAGLGYAILGLFAFVGTVIGVVINMVIRYLKKKGASN